VALALTAGNYSVAPISASDGALYTGVSYWASSNCVVSTGCVQTSPTTNTGFMYKYDVKSTAISAASVGGVDLTPLNPGPPPSNIFGSYWEKSASDNFVRVSEGVVYPTQADAFQSAQAMTFSLDSDATVFFGIFDTLPSDNRGGISLLLSAELQPPPSVPLPSAMMLAFSAIGLGALGHRSLRKRKSQA
jgi:hypothetical protein